MVEVETVFAVDEVVVVNICTLLQELCGPALIDLSYEQECAMVRAWIEKKNAHYYARPKEDFFVAEAVFEAKKAGKMIVVVEDLS